MSVKVQQQIHAPGLTNSLPSAQRASRPIRLGHPDEPRLDATLQAEIGRKLRAYYADLVSEPVPQRFADLLARLDRKH
jgi:hypothetical protein